MVPKSRVSPLSYWPSTSPFPEIETPANCPAAVPLTSIELTANARPDSDEPAKFSAMFSGAAPFGSDEIVIVPLPEVSLPLLSNDSVGPLPVATELPLLSVSW